MRAYDFPILKICRLGRESNPQPWVYEAGTLPQRHRAGKKKKKCQYCELVLYFFVKLVNGLIKFRLKSRILFQIITESKPVDEVHKNLGPNL